MHTAVPVLERICAKTYTIPKEKSNERPLTLEAGTCIWLPVYAIHRDEKLFPKPDVFDPERFSKDNKYNIQSGSYFPFGVGPRDCIGNVIIVYQVE